DDHDVTPKPLGFGDATACDCDAIARLGEDTDSDLGAEHTQLLDGCRTLKVRADQVGTTALVAKPVGQLGRSCRLTGPLKAREQYDRWGLGGIADLERLTAEGGRQLLVHHLDDLLRWGEMLSQLGTGAPRTDPFDEVLHNGEVDVGLEKCDSDLAENLGDLSVAEPAAAAKAREDSFETISQGVEHGPDQVSRTAAPV